MTAPTVSVGERYTDDLRRHSALIVHAVHRLGLDRAGEAVDRALILPAPPGVDPAVALAVVLAAQVDPDATRRQTLGWIEGAA